MESTWNASGQLVKLYEFEKWDDSFLSEAGTAETTYEFERSPAEITFYYRAVQNGGQPYTGYYTYYLNSIGQCYLRTHSDNSDSLFFYYNTNGFLTSVESHYLGKIQETHAFTYENGNLTKAHVDQWDYEFEYDSFANTDVYPFQLELIGHWMSFLNCFGNTNANNVKIMRQKPHAVTTFSTFNVIRKMDSCDRISTFKNAFEAGFEFKY